MKEIELRYQAWLTHPEMPKKLLTELKKMSEKGKTDAFYQDLAFGTAGMRAILGAGTNRMNIFTVRRAALGFGLYLLANFPDAKNAGVVIAHDNRHMANEFTNETSNALRSLGIKTFLFDELKPTPLLSYAVRHVHAVGGVMITASHNPKNYNGFKVYDETGAQLIPTKVDELLTHINKLPSVLEIPKPVVPINNYALLSDDVENTYFAKVIKLQLRREQPKNGFKIVYSPQHGAGRRLVMGALNVMGYEVISVTSQMEPDPNFSHTKSPNPEDISAYNEAIKYANAHGAHLIITTDPDADRLGLVIRNKEGGYDYLTGNQSAALLIDYLAKAMKEKNIAYAGKYLYTTIVTGSLGPKVALSHGLKVKEFLTGFKFIGAQIAEDDAQKADNFFFGYEESYGLLASSFVRDKDAVQAVVLYAEMALYYHLQGKTLDVVLDELYAEHGYHLEPTKSFAFPGASGQAKMHDVLSGLRANPPVDIGGLKVLSREDYLSGEKVHNGQVTKLALPASDVLRYHLEGGTRIAIRPSGTEPKCKVYFGIVTNDKKEAQELLSRLEAAISAYFI